MNPSGERDDELRRLSSIVFAWAYLESESVTPPIIMHGCGNLVVIGADLAAAILVS